MDGLIRDVSSILSGKMCCCTNNDANRFVFDVVRPENTCQDIVKEMHMPIPTGTEGGHEDPNAMSPYKPSEANIRSLQPQLLMAVKRDDGPGVLQYVADGTDFADMSEALRFAAHRGSTSVVRELVAVGLTVNDSCPSTGYTPLQLAATSGHLLVCELLLDALADVHQRIGGEKGPTALSLARKMGNPEVEEVIEQHIARQLVMEQGVTSDMPESPSQTRLHVLPRVSHGLSEVMLKNVKPPNAKVGPPGFGSLADSPGGAASIPNGFGATIASRVPCPPRRPSSGDARINVRGSVEGGTGGSTEENAVVGAVSVPTGGGGSGSGEGASPTASRGSPNKDISDGGAASSCRAGVAPGRSFLSIGGGGLGRSATGTRVSHSGIEAPGGATNAIDDEFSMLAGPGLPEAATLLLGGSSTSEAAPGVRSPPPGWSQIDSTTLAVLRNSDPTCVPEGLPETVGLPASVAL
eukprot:TRINITY_DN5955_c0_g2_i1.p1 TRINITY_DN5955_c0_g2~~TRINITY_DN5955_c0_g2_i1.p1  ORF type:complete len:466 (+),score=69.96 TRINITY_DN5955_c0_g2_i1:141-1538(+)